MMSRILVGLAASVVMAAGSTTALAQGTAITYQGQLRAAGNAVNTPTDMQFSLFTAASGGTQVGSTVTLNAVAVNQGLFTTPIDFGVNPYTSNQALFLQIAVRNPAGSGSFVPMGARQALTPAPFALATRGINVDFFGRAVALAFASSGQNFGAFFETADLPIGTGPAAGTQLVARAVGNNSGPQLRLQRSLNATNFIDLGQNTNGDFVIEANDNPQVLVTSSGNVGIGVTNVGRKLDVAGGIVVDANNQNAGVNGPGGFLDLNVLHLGGGGSGEGIGSTKVTGGPNRNGIDFFTDYTRRMSITNGGNVGIANATPPELLSVGSFGLAGAFDRYIQISTEGGNQHRAGLKLRHSNNGGGYTIESDERGPSVGAFGLNVIDLNFGPGAGTPQSVLLIQKSSGFIGIGTTAPAARLHNTGTTRLDGQLSFGAQTFGGGSGANANFTRGSNTLALDMSSNGFNDFVISNNGAFTIVLGNDGFASKVGGGAWAVLSDERTKTDVQSLSGTLDRLLKLKGHKYTYKPEYVENGKALPGTQIGLVAQEVEEVFPDWVTTGRDGLKVVTERSTTALMVEAMRDLRNEKDAEITALKERLEKLEAMIAAQNTTK